MPLDPLKIVVPSSFLLRETKARNTNFCVGHTVAQNIGRTDDVPVGQEKFTRQSICCPKISEVY